MTNLVKIHNMKERLKELATKIRESKPHSYPLDTECRHLHMIYGVFRGIPMKSIERKCREPLQEYYLKKIIEKFEVEVNYDEIIRYSCSITF